jgi:hypothetical protein
MNQYDINKYAWQKWEWINMHEARIKWNARVNIANNEIISSTRLTKQG